MRTLTSAILCGILGVATAASAGPVETFKSVCLPNLGNPDAIAASAKSQGFKTSPLSEMLGGYIADRKKTDETVQVNIATKHNFECAITTSDVDNPDQLRAQFFEALGIPTSKSQVTAKVNGQRYVFMFDTQGGEALVVYRK